MEILEVRHQNSADVVLAFQRWRQGKIDVISMPPGLYSIVLGRLRMLKQLLSQ